MPRALVIYPRFINTINKSFTLSINSSLLKYYITHVFIRNNVFVVDVEFRAG